MSTVALTQQTLAALQTLARWWGIDLDRDHAHLRAVAAQHPEAFAQVMEALAASIRRDKAYGTTERMRAAIEADAAAQAAGLHSRARP